MTSWSARGSLVVVCMIVCRCGGGQPPQPPPTRAERPAGSGWVRRLPQKPPDQLTFADFKKAFDDEYAGAPEPRPDDRVGKETRGLFRRWEWFTWPRVYPAGVWNSSDVYNELQKVRESDLTSLAGMAAFMATMPPWRPYGPSDAVGGTSAGRVNAIAFDPTNANTIYIGAADGGVWRSTNGGTSWIVLTDKLPTLSIADIAIDPTNTQHIYIATGDGYGHNNPFWGGTYSMGVWVTSNGGLTWSPTPGLSFSVGQNRTIRRLVMHPTNPAILLAATSEGLFRTTDGGTTWPQVTTVPTYDVEFDPLSSDAAYVTTTELVKLTWTGTGMTTTSLAPNCFDMRFSVEVAASNPKTVYALCSNGTLNKSADGGSTWNTMSPPPANLFGYYGTVLAVSPVDPDTIVAAGQDMAISTTGGSSWTSVLPAPPHADHHAVRFRPGSSTMIFDGSDGGMFLYDKSGSTPTWQSLNTGLQITQFYRVGLASPTIGVLIASAQDNGNMKKAGTTWSLLTGDDGTGGFIDYKNPNNVFTERGQGVLDRAPTGVPPLFSINAPGTSAWVAPFLQDPARATTIYTATDRVYKSTAQGAPGSWTPISPPLAGVTTFTILKVNKNPTYILAGSGSQPGNGRQPGKLYRSPNGGMTWPDVTSGLPVSIADLSDATISDVDPNIMWATFSGFVAGQKVYKWTSTSGWKNVSAGLPNIPVNCIVAERKPGNPIYVGTDAGVYYLRDGLPHFVPFKVGLPNVIVDELEINYPFQKIVAATYGRGLWLASLIP